MTLFRSLKLMLGLAFVAAMLLAQPSIGAVVYSQTPYRDGYSGLASDVANTYYPESIALAGPVSITSLTWWGYFGPFSGTSSTQFDVLLNGDLQAGLLSSVDDPLPDGLVRYTLDLTASPYLFAGGLLDVELGHSDIDAQWFWQGATDDVLALGPRALLVEGARLSTVPEPGTLALMVIAAFLLIALSRRNPASLTSRLG